MESWHLYYSTSPQGTKHIVLCIVDTDPSRKRKVFRQTIDNQGQRVIDTSAAGEELDVMKNGFISSMSLSDFDQMLPINLRGTFLMMTEASRHLENDGRFIALSSRAIAKSMPPYGPYIASKAGVGESGEGVCE